MARDVRSVLKRGAAVIADCEPRSAIELWLSWDSLVNQGDCPGAANQRCIMQPACNDQFSIRSFLPTWNRPNGRSDYATINVAIHLY